jgi:hypothetical protein
MVARRMIICHVVDSPYAALATSHAITSPSSLSVGSTRNLSSSSSCPSLNASCIPKSLLDHLISVLARLPDLTIGVRLVR